VVNQDPTFIATIYLKGFIDKKVLVALWCLNATFNNISVISWRLVLLVEETTAPGKNH
jgi:hypothetical protein